jgi:hypothetical protein
VSIQSPPKTPSWITAAACNARDAKTESSPQIISV